MAVVAKWYVITKDKEYSPGEIITNLPKEKELELIAKGHVASYVEAVKKPGEVEIVVPEEIVSSGVDFLELILSVMTKTEIIDFAESAGLSLSKYDKKDKLIKACMDNELEIDIDVLPTNAVIAIAHEMKIDTEGKEIEQIRNLIAGE